MTTSDRFPVPPLAPYDATVLPEWIDYNGHMNVAYYLLAFDHATDAVLDGLGIGKDYVAAANRSVFVADAHLTYAREVTEGAPLSIRPRLLGADAKRLHLFHEMRHGTEGWLAATAEFMLLHVDLAARKTCAFPPGIAAALAERAAAQGGAPWPPQAGRAVRRLDGGGTG